MSDTVSTHSEDTESSFTKDGPFSPTPQVGTIQYNDKKTMSTSCTCSGEASSWRDPLLHREAQQREFIRPGDQQTAHRQLELPAGHREAVVVCRGRRPQGGGHIQCGQ